MCRADPRGGPPLAMDPRPLRGQGIGSRRGLFVIRVRRLFPARSNDGGSDLASGRRRSWTVQVMAQQFASLGRFSARGACAGSRTLNLSLATDGRRIVVGVRRHSETKTGEDASVVIGEAANPGGK